MRGITEELEQPDWTDVRDELQDPESTAQWLLAVKAYEEASDSDKHAVVEDSVDSVANKHEKRVAIGDSDDESSVSFDRLMELAKGYTAKMETEVEPDPRHIQELLRFGKAKLHNVSAYLGGVAATEAIKLVTKQYIPMSNTLIYDGIHARGTVFNL